MKEKTTITMHLESLTTTHLEHGYFSGTVQVIRTKTMSSGVSYTDGRQRFDVVGWPEYGSFDVELKLSTNYNELEFGQKALKKVYSKLQDVASRYDRTSLNSAHSLAYDLYKACELATTKQWDDDSLEDTRAAILEKAREAGNMELELRIAHVRKQLDEIEKEKAYHPDTNESN